MILVFCLPKVASHKCEVCEETTRAVLHVYSLLCVAGNVRVIHHVELDVLQRGSLSNLPVNGTDIGRGIRLTNVDFEIPHTAQEIVLIDIPLLVITDIDIGSDDTQTDEA